LDDYLGVAPRTSRFEHHSLIAAVLLLVAGPFVAAANGTLGGSARLVGIIGLGVLGLHALSRGVRLYRAGAPASLPRSVGRVTVRVRPGRISSVATASLALVLPVAAGVALVALVEWVWLPLGAALVLGGLATLLKAPEEPLEPYRRDPPREVPALLERLCMRADVPVPELIVEGDVEANAWTTRGRIHITTRLLRALDRSELEAVLAHEVAHLANRDAAVMDVFSAPSRVLLGYAAGLLAGLKFWLKNLFEIPFPGVAIWGAILAVLSGPPAFALGWVSRLSLLRMSRTREFTADAAAAALTGRPNALASALVKLDRQTSWIPRADLREAEARAVLCILGRDRSRLGRLFATHPPVAARVKRLEAIEERVQDGGRAVSLER
jgi:heat shock protein HtpX